MTLTRIPDRQLLPCELPPSRDGSVISCETSDISCAGQHKTTIADTTRQAKHTSTQDHLCDRSVAGSDPSRSPWGRPLADLRVRQRRSAPRRMRPGRDQDGGTGPHSIEMRHSRPNIESEKRVGSCSRGREIASAADNPGRRARTRTSRNRARRSSVMQERRGSDSESGGRRRVGPPTSPRQPDGPRPADGRRSRPHRRLECGAHWARPGHR